VVIIALSVGYLTGTALWTFILHEDLRWMEKLKYSLVTLVVSGCLVVGLAGCTDTERASQMVRFARKEGLIR
jgi:hypothetical protein